MNAPAKAHTRSERAPEFLVVGAGAIGSLLGGSLALAGRSVAFYDQDPTVRKALSQHGLILERPQGTIRIPVQVLQDPTEAETPKWLALCVKAVHTEQAAQATAPLAQAGAVTVSFQNGIQNGEILARVLGQAPVLLTSLSVGAYLRAPGQVVQTGNGPIRIGAQDPRHQALAERLAEILDEAGFRAQAVSDIRRALWAKLAVNAVVNPLTALLEVENGRLGHLEAARELAQRVVSELVAVAHEEGVPLEDEEVLSEVWRVVEATARNRSSMLQDLLAGRPSEIEALNGALVQIGARHGLSLPVNETLVQLTRAKFQTRGQRIHEPEPPERDPDVDPSGSV